MIKIPSLTKCVLFKAKFLTKCMVHMSFSLLLQDFKYYPSYMTSAMIEILSLFHFALVLPMLIFKMKLPARTFLHHKLDFFSLNLVILGIKIIFEIKLRITIKMLHKIHLKSFLKYTSIIPKYRKIS